MSERKIIIIKKKVESVNTISTSSENSNVPKQNDLHQSEFICRALTNKMQRCPFKHITDSMYCTKHTNKREFGDLDHPIPPKQKKEKKMENFESMLVRVESDIIPVNYDQLMNIDLDSESI